MNNVCACGRPSNGWCGVCPQNAPQTPDRPTKYTDQIDDLRDDARNLTRDASIMRDKLDGFRADFGILIAENASLKRSMKESEDGWFSVSIAQIVNDRDAYRRGQQKYLSDLKNLLARIHRDGGHYTAEKGLAQSVEDAHTVVAELLSNYDNDKPQEEHAPSCSCHICIGAVL